MEGEGRQGCDRHTSHLIQVIIISVWSSRPGKAGWGEGRQGWGEAVWSPWEKEGEEMEKLRKRGKGERE